jgi:hypothetical protein
LNRNLVDHFVEFSFNFSFKIRSDLVDIGELGKGPAAIFAKVVYTGHPVGLHGRLLFLGVFTPIAFDLNNQVQRVVLPVVYLAAEFIDYWGGIVLLLLR